MRKGEKGRELEEEEKKLISKFFPVLSRARVDVMSLQSTGNNYSQANISPCVNLAWSPCVIQL